MLFDEKTVSTSWHEEFGHAVFTAMTPMGIGVYGEAQRHEDDKDLGNERTGLTIAEARAVIQALRAKREYEIKPKLAILKHLYSNIQTSKNHDPKSHESRMIRSQIRAIERELAEVNNDIAEEQRSLKEYIDNKDKMYNKLREKAKDQQS